MQLIASVFFALLGLCGVLMAANQEFSFRSCSQREKCVYMTRCSAVRFNSGNSEEVIRLISKHACGLRSDYLKICCPNDYVRYKKSVEGADVASTCGRNYGTFSSDSHTQPGEFPWIATVVLKNPSGDDETCSGSLISESFVLTAAECVSKEGTSQSSVTVLLGGEETEYDVQYVSVHPSENVALLHLDAAVTITPYVSPICLEPLTYNLEYTTGYNQVIETGWEDSSSAEDELMKTLSELVPCPQPSLKTVCALATGNRCYRTVGGPLVKMFNNSFTIVGVATSSADDSRCAQEPAVYTSVQHIMPWILDNILL